MYCAECDEIITGETIERDGREICEECHADRDAQDVSNQLDINDALKRYKAQHNITDDDDDDFLRSLIGQVAGGYQQRASWWTDSEAMLDVAYVVSCSQSGMEVIGVEVVSGTGGPHVWLDTRNRLIKVRWGNHYTERSVTAEVAEEVCEYYAELFDSYR